MKEKSWKTHTHTHTHTHKHTHTEVYTHTKKGESTTSKFKTTKPPKLHAYSQKKT